MPCSMEGSSEERSPSRAANGRNSAQDPVSTTSGVAQVAQTLSPAHIQPDASVAVASASTKVKRTSSALPNESAQQSSMPGPHAGLKPWPSIQSSLKDEQPLTSSSAPNITTSSPHFSRPSPNKQASFTSDQPYYDSANQPLSVSQQTSASAVRDMALRKGNPTVLKKGEQPPEQQPQQQQRPLKSALKSFSSKKVDLSFPQQAFPVMSPPLQPKEKSRFPRFSNLLSRNSSSQTDRSGLFSPLSRTQSGHSGHSDRQTPNSLRPKRSIGWDQPLQQYDEARNSSVQSDVSDRVRQAKLAEGDVYESAKKNVRRPPKGIQNWFDGFNISSDEEDITPLAKPQPQQETRKQSYERDVTSQQRQYDARQQNTLSKAERLLGHSMPPARHDNDSLHDRLVPADQDRYQGEDYFDFTGNTTPKPQQQPFRNPGYSSSHHTSSNSRGSSYDTSDRSDFYYRGSDHYSSNSDAVQHARAVDLNRPIIPPRRMQNVQNLPREWQRPQLNHYQSSSSRPPLPSYNSSSKFSSQSRRTLEEDEEDGRASTFKSYNTASSGSTATRGRGRVSTRMSSSIGQSESTGGVPIDRLAAEIQHTIAVTEEEMALLEMMRNKRAAMNKPSYTKGYRKALEKEHEQLMQRRLLAQQTALEILRDQQRLYSQRDETEETNDTTDGEVDEHEIMRLDKLRLQEMARIQQLEKFLATNASLAAALHDPGMQDKSRGPSASGARPKYNRADSSQQESVRSNSRHQRRIGREELYSPPLDFPSPPAYDEERLQYGDRPKKARSAVKAARHLATLEEERLSAAYERAQRKSRSVLANHSSENVLAQRQSQAENDRIRKKAQTPTFLRSISDYQSQEQRSATSRDTSVNASVVSPLTPNSLDPVEPVKRSSFGPLDSEDDIRFPPDNSSPELNFSKPSRGLPAMPDHRRKHKKQLPSALAIIADEDRRNGRDSLESSGSAGGDVLAAWAELGGAEGNLPGRRPRAR